MGTIHNPHDNFFKTAMLNLQVSKEFFEYHLPAALQSRLDLNTLELQPGTYINKALQATESDVLYKVKLRGESESIYLYVLVEHQSSIDYLMPLRFLEYTAAIWRKLVRKAGKKSRNKNFKLPLIVPLLFYNGQEPYNGSTNIQELIDAPREMIEAFCLQPFQLIDLNNISDLALRDKKWLEAVEMVMKHVHVREILDYIQDMLRSIRFTWREGDRELSISMLEYILSERQTSDPDRLMEILKTALVEGDMMGTVAEYLVRKSEGEVLIRLLECKFKTNPVPECYQQQVQKANSETLLKWIERVLTSPSLEGVFEA